MSARRTSATVEKTCGASGKSPAGCCVHNLSAAGEQIPHLQPAGGKTPQGFWAK